MLPLACHTGAHGRPARPLWRLREPAWLPPDPPSRPGRRGRWPRHSTTRTRRAGGRARSSPTSPRWSPYWLGEIERVLAGDPEPGAVRPGRDRPGAHRPRRTRPVAPAARAVRPDRRTTCQRFDRRWRTLSPAELARRGLHPTPRRADGRGDARRFIVGHLADHVAAARGDPGRAGRPPRDVTAARARLDPAGDRPPDRDRLLLPGPVSCA